MHRSCNTHTHFKNRHIALELCRVVTLPLTLISPQNGGAYNLTSVRTSVRTYVRQSVDSDFSEVYGSTGLKL